MADSTAASTGTALPKGGGALQGLGEKFSPDLHTGTGNFSIPLMLPAGRNGFAPQLALSYTTGGGNGPFGLGFDIAIPSVQRRTAKGVPRYRDGAADPRLHDVFILSGTEDLVPVSTSDDATSYRPRTEGLFAWIERRTALDHWVVHSKDGSVSRYGAPLPGEGDRAIVEHPSASSRIFAWKLSDSVDAFGNRIEYRYERERSTGTQSSDQLYIKQIRYADYADGDATRYLVSVEFDYAERPDPITDGRAGFEIRTSRRCTRISVWTHAGEDRLVRTYDLVYLDQRALEQPAEFAHLVPLNGVSLLSRVVVTGHDGTASESLPPLDFGYTRFEPSRRQLTRLAGNALPPQSFATGSLELVDLFGRGLPDILEMNGVVRYWRNLGDGRFDAPRAMATAPAGLRLGEAGVQLLDADGDGRTDLLVTRGDTAGYYPLSFRGGWDARSFQSYERAPSFLLTDPEVHLLDLNGDGVTDAVRSGERLECFFNDPDAGWTEMRPVDRRGLAAFPNIPFTDPRVKWADMTGDGLQDVVLVDQGGVDYWPSHGWGTWGARVSMRASVDLPYGYDPRRVLLGDVDGDGAADLLYVDDGSVTLWLNRSGIGWSDRIVIRGTPAVADTDTVRLADVLGTGIPGLLWSADAEIGGKPRMFFLDFAGGNKPYLLSEIRNNLGSVTRLTYAPSTRYYLADQAHPDRRWTTPLPFPVHVVARSESIDEISGGRLTTEYTYHHGYWDGAEREFRGFGRVDQRDTELFTGPGEAPEWFAPPMETRTWFHQGPVGDAYGEWGHPDYTAEYWPGDSAVPPVDARTAGMLAALPRRARRDALRTLRGMVLRTEVYARDAGLRQDRPYTVTNAVFGVREESPPGSDPPDRARIFFPHPVVQHTTQWERGSDPMRSVSFTDGYDAYGRPRWQTTVAVPRDRDPRVAAPPGAPYLATHTETRYATRDDATVLLADRVASVTTWELVNDGALTAEALAAAAVAGTAPRRVIGQILTYYDGAAFEGLPLGDPGRYGAEVRVEHLVLTPEVVRDAYRSGASVMTPAEEPPYLAADGGLAWPAEYPQAFRDAMPPLAGYTRRTDAASGFVGYYAATLRQQYDFQAGEPARGMVVATRGALGGITTLEYDRYRLLATLTRDPAGLTTAAEYDYRLLQPALATDANGNRTAYAYTPLGLLRSTALLGRAGESVGDSLEKPGTRYEYDLGAFLRARQPVSIRTLRRVHHANDVNVPAAERDAVIETREYTDGFGRLLQRRMQAEAVVFGDPVFGDAGLPADPASGAGSAVGAALAGGATRVVVSGWQTYDNKGRVVEKFEPFFAESWDVQSRAQADPAVFGARVRIVYDPRGQVTRTINPDGSEQRVVYGRPAALDDPETFTPTPWEVYTYDANDNAGRTHAAASAPYARHWNTPSSAVLDALGRVVRAVERNGPDPTTDWHVIDSTLDVRGNRLAVTDPLGRVAFRTVYDLTDRPLRIERLDGGTARLVLDAAGGEVERRDAVGAMELRAFDALRRPVRLWARDAAGRPVTLRERLEYGDAGDPAQPAAEREAQRAVNRLGRLHRHYSEAGLLVTDAYDFKGGVGERTQRVVADAVLLRTFVDAAADAWRVPVPVVDWEPSESGTLSEREAELLDARPYTTTTRHDALDRLRLLRYPLDASGMRRELRPQYNAAGALVRVTVDGDVYVDLVAYDARGNRTLIAYGNGVMTRCTYDARTFRLARLRTERYERLAGPPVTFRPAAPASPLQDLCYAYDQVGNVLSIVDRVPGSGSMGDPDAFDPALDPVLARLIAGGDASVRRFAYDPLYRLTSASGRECIAGAEQAPAPWTDAPRCGFGSGAHGTPTQDNAPQLTTRYTERYAYDAAGNLTSVRHERGDGAWLRRFGFSGNRLTHTAAGDAAPPTATYEYDAAGNLVRVNVERRLTWDHAGRLRAYRVQPPASGSAPAEDRWAEPSIFAHYLYDPNGERVKKLVRTQGGGWESVVYVAGLFEHRRWSAGGDAPAENTVVHVLDDQRRVVTARMGPAQPDDQGPAVQYHLADHLGSGALVVDGAGGWVNREELSPFGETTFGGFARKRYRFTGRERDAESGLCHHGARYYAPWLCRWVSCDPSGAVDGTNLYAYVRNNPLRIVDPGGRQGAPASQKPQTGARPEKKDGDASDAGQIAGAAHGGKAAKIATAAPKSPKGMPNDGTLNLYTGEAGEAAADKAKGYNMKQTKKGADVDRALKEAQAGNGGKPISENAKRAICDPPSKETAVRAALAEHPVATHGDAGSQSVQARVEQPAVKTWGQISGVLTAGSGVVTILAATQSDNTLERAVGVTGGAMEVGGGVTYAAGATKVGTAAGTTLMRVGAGLSRYGGGGATVVLSAAGLYQDVKRGDVASGVGNAAGTATGVLTIAGSTAGAAVTGSFAAGYGVGTLINDHLLSAETKNAIGGTLNEIINNGGWKHPFGIGM